MAYKLSEGIFSLLYINSPRLLMTSANIFGLAILENPRSESGAPANRKGVVFDAQFYLGPGHVAVGCLRYFNDADIAFDEGGTYFVCATVSFCDVQVCLSLYVRYKCELQVAKLLPGAETHSTTTSLSTEDYQFVGDIQWVRDTFTLTAIIMFNLNINS